MKLFRTKQVRIYQSIFFLLVTSFCAPTGSIATEVSKGVATSEIAETKTDKEVQKEKDLFSLDLENLGKVEAAPLPENLRGSPSSVLDANDVRNSGASTTGELLEKAAGVNVRRTSALNLDPMVRGYNSEQINASASGVTQLKTRVDIDSLFSQIDPGIVHDVTIVDGPYTSLYGPGFAFLVVDLYQTQRTEEGTEIHSITNSSYETNGQIFYTRETLSMAGTDYGVLFSYGIRTGNDYLIGGDIEYYVPASFKKWDTLLSLSKDVGIDRRIDFTYLRTEINGLELPGIAYDMNYSGNDQFDLKYAVKDGRDGIDRWTIQSFMSNTKYDMDASSPTKQRTFFEQFITIPTFNSVGDDAVGLTGKGRLNTAGVRSYLTFGEKDSRLCNLGIDYRRSSLAYEELNINSDGSVAWGGNMYGIPACYQNDVGLFTNILNPLNDVFTLDVGGRVDYVQSNVRADDPVITQITDPSELYYLPGAFESEQWLGMTYATGKLKTSEFTQLSSGVGFAMRAPSLTELYTDEAYVPVARFGNSFVDGNSGLESEKNVQFDLGIEYKKDRWRYGTRGFVATIHDYIMPAPYFIIATTPGAATYGLGRDFSSFPPDYREDLTYGTPNADQSQAGYRYTNADRVTIGGGDLYLEMPLAESWALHGTLSYVEGTNHDPQAFVPDAVYPNGGTVVHLGGSTPLQGIYPLNGTIQLRWFEPEQERYAVTFATQLVAAQDRVSATLGEPPTAGFVVCSLRSYWQLTDHLKFTAGIENLFDERYTQHGSLGFIGPGGIPAFIPEPGRSGVFGLELRY